MHSSKPIRRPQLKKVLKEYCAPIPEENEDASPDERKNSGVNTTIVLNAPGVAATMPSEPGSSSGRGFEQRLIPTPPPENGNGGDSRPVSPGCVS